MTIAAGFRVQDGIVICADTLYTGAMKIHQQKLFPATIGDSEHPEHFVFALAGSEAYGKMAIDECVEALKQLPVAERSLTNVKAVLRRTVKRMQEDYITCRPEVERPGIDFQFIIGAWLPRGGGPQLFSTSGSAVNLEYHYACVGTGEYLAHYLIRPVFSHIMHVPSVVVLATQVVGALKAYDTNCGGLTTFTIIQNGKLNSALGYPFHQVELLVSQYEQMAREFLFSATNSGMDDAAFDNAMKVFTEHVQHVRNTWRKNVDVFERSLHSTSSGQQSD